MVLDRQRNDAYQAAIQAAVARKRASGCADILALDMGAGSGLLSMMAARWGGSCLLPSVGLGNASRAPLAPAPARASPCRAGADSVIAAEINQHMCDVGEEATIMNGFLGTITMLDRCLRMLRTAPMLRAG